MGIEYESILDHPLAEVFAWHTRPGAMSRLVPPWQPMTVLSETESLADGRAVLGLPGGLRWVAQHDPAGFDPPYRFVDVLSSAGAASWPARVIGWWRHTHEFSDGDRRHAGARPRRHLGAGGGPARHLRLPPPTARRRPERTPRRRRGRRAADDGCRHRRVRTGRLGPDGIPDHRRAPGHPPGATPRARQG